MPAIARRLFIPDYPAGTPGQVLGIQSDGTAAWIAGGGGTSVFQSVDALTANPRAVTDWGPIINAAIAGGTKYLVFGPFDYPYTTKIDFHGINNVIFQGAGAVCWSAVPGGQGFTRLVWNGTGAGNAIDASVTNATSFRDMAFTYSSVSYTGTLINVSGSGAGQFSARNCHFCYAAGGQTITAAYAFDLGKSLIPVFDTCTFEGFLTYVLGFDGVTNGYCNSAQFLNCVFQGQCQHSIINPGQAWKFDTCIFESLGAADQTVQSHIQCNVTNNSGTPTHLHLVNCTHWDASSTATRWIATVAGIEVHIRLDDCIENNTSLTKSLDLQSNGTISIHGGSMGGPIDFGDASVATHTKTAISLGGGLEINNSLINLDSGPGAHRNVDIGAVWDFADGSSFTRSYRTGIEQEVARTSSAYVPTVTVNGGAPANISLFAQSGNDARGTVQAHYTGAGTSGTGLLLDVTFAKHPALNPNFSPQPVVTLTPMDATAAACQAYATVNAGTPGKFTVGIVVGIPSGGTPNWAYAVTWV